MPTSTRKSKPPETPWDRDNPKKETGEKHTTLTPSAKATAKRHAKAAGRPYPNLVDNMAAARAVKAKAK